MFKTFSRWWRLSRVLSWLSIVAIIFKLQFLLPRSRYTDTRTNFGKGFEEATGMWNSDKSKEPSVQTKGAFPGSGLHYHCLGSWRHLKMFSPSKRIRFWPTNLLKVAQGLPEFTAVCFSNVHPETFTRSDFEGFRGSLEIDLAGWMMFNLPGTCSVRWTALSFSYYGSCQISRCQCCHLFVSSWITTLRRE